MSKLSPALKAAIASPHARSGTIPAPPGIRAVYESMARDAAARNIGLQPWLTIATAATLTLNSPESLTILHAVASAPPANALANAELIREVGLKCISFSGIPRTINVLGAFTASLPPLLVAQLSSTPTRKPTATNLSAIAHAGRALWNNIYAPFSAKLLERLAASHPDLPVHILNSHYGPLLAEPFAREGAAVVGRVLTSLVAVACLRAQTGVGPQVVSHLFGLRKAFEGEGGEEVQGGRWLASDEGGLWILEMVDGIVDAIGGGQGTTFAPGIKAKL